MHGPSGGCYEAILFAVFVAEKPRQVRAEKAFVKVMLNYSSPPLYLGTYSHRKWVKSDQRLMFSVQLKIGCVCWYNSVYEICTSPQRISIDMQGVVEERTRKGLKVKTQGMPAEHVKQKCAFENLKPDTCITYI